MVVVAAVAMLIVATGCGQLAPATNWAAVAVVAVAAAAAQFGEKGKVEDGAGAAAADDDP